MINKLLALSAIFAAYLILMMPVAYAQAVSSISYESEKQPDEVLGNLMIAIPTFLADIVDVIKTVIENFMDSVIPGAKAQACDGDGTCGGSEYAQDCCFDCGCYAGHYCDWDGVSDKADISCRLYTDINLVSASIYPTIFENCNEAHETNITLIINDPPSSMIFTGKKLLLNSGSQKVPIGDCGLQSESIPGQSIYKCAVTIPVLPSCGTGQNTITHNSVQLNLSFKNGATNDRYDLVKSAPDISINSFTCGNGIPETSIGEDSTNCCFDAGCFSNWFCDITESDATSNPSAGTCRSKLSINDVSVSTPATTSFKTHDTSTGTDISFDLRVSNVNGLKFIQTPT
ncbi:MAG: hypothetical protein KKC05_03215, partial [Nanoarchaeota archaeon]|nr:hypothetical protein [Nanoarchaeota archaeon]